ncbi:hypothetical protein [Flavobacterium saccharophilum]|uniref:Uncharacterized protein n=1 Tax=Flavobacterium saccharophilum TaxID=29534 RepID=A0A1M7JL44_9FLAO|nr:hypothetical protein [Flavobacterium saccharophilum]SHM53655.1 hypothetical protein SAMN05444366_3408 [Flavobacterium saccharophilum]
MKPKSAELAVVIVTQHEAIKKLQARKSNIEILNNHFKQTGTTYVTYKGLTKIERKKTPTNSIHQMIVWKN